MPEIRSHYFVTKLQLFGSNARGEQTAQSDVDLLVEFSQPVGFEFFELKTFLEDRLSKNVDLVTTAALKSALKPFVLAEVIPIE